MINFKTLITAICIVFFTCFSAAFANENQISGKDAQYQKIYDTLEEADFNYIFGLDPYQAEEYKEYMHTPYPLFRTSVRMVFKNSVIEPGYYLLTPREKNGRWYVLFKQNGKVKYTIPVYEKDLVEPAFYETYVPERKLTCWQSIKQKFVNTIGRMFPESTQRKPAPKSYIDVNELGSNFWQVILYWGTQKYYLIFMR